jgi:(p)ppGpp synthase/HD superfamily hydrolase
MLDEKKGLKDLVGTTVAFDDYEDLKNFKNKAKKGLYGKVIDFDDYYESPKDGYRAFHFVIEQNGVPIELQLKTNRMKDVNVLSHDAYKNKKLNKDYMLYLTTLADNADKGNKTAQNEFSRLMSNKSQVEKQLNN